MRKRRGSLSLLLDKKMYVCGASMWWIERGWSAVREEQAREEGVRRETGGREGQNKIQRTNEI